MWGILFLLHNPQVQSRIHQDLDRVLNARRNKGESLGEMSPRLTDAPDLPYIKATIIEIHRFATMLPFAVPRHHNLCAKLKFRW